MAVFPLTSGEGRKCRISNDLGSSGLLPDASTPERGPGSAAIGLRKTPLCLDSLLSDDGRTACASETLKFGTQIRTPNFWIVWHFSIVGRIENRHGSQSTDGDNIFQGLSGFWVESVKQRGFVHVFGVQPPATLTPRLIISCKKNLNRGYFAGKEHPGSSVIELRETIRSEVGMASTLGRNL
ncbi:uncharacterized protein LY89DRAFT_665284 [Mollisia scopiformis]|uniref:Uncharacterized protein n=1 Tax=Mollisia scopiformis TaxID=149040 RepID=A0A194XQZ4_MOLSC|nr:uncharacterized protein LY89DRAFT_665284 [Mollisia scopiformis]KUJ22152.1 hypothetical protein LY89DRAFT_665284 [Mollisia scopiformis]